MYALVTATNMIKAGTHRTVVVIGAEKLHYHLDFTNRATAVLFGDGAGAVVLEATDDDLGVLASELGMDGSATGILEIPKEGTSGDRGQADPTLAGIQMDGPEVFQARRHDDGRRLAAGAREGRYLSR